jgi:hypothetical protein
MEENESPPPQAVLKMCLRYSLLSGMQTKILLFNLRVLNKKNRIQVEAHRQGKIS